jgi:aminoglycoside phosphotransferase (APT) family kinase protein
VNPASVTDRASAELVGRPAAARPSLWEFVAGSGLRSVVVGLSKDPNAKVVVLLVSPRSGRAVLAVKAATTDAAARAVEAETRVLLRLSARRPRLALETVPRVVEVVEFRSRPALVMTAMQGRPMTVSYLSWRHTASPRRVARDFDAVGDWLADLQLGTARQDAPVDMDGGVRSRLARRFWADRRVADDVARLEEINARLRGQSTPRTVVHGDLWLGNVLLSGGRVSGVIDWEAGAEAGEPVRDLVRFAHMYALYLDRRTRGGRRVAGHGGLRAGRWGAALEYALAGAGWFPALFRRFIGDGLARLGASPAAWRDAALAGIAEVAAFTDEDAFARAHLELFRRVARSQPCRKEVR